MLHDVASAPLALHWTPHGGLQWGIFAVIILVLVGGRVLMRRKR
jgi:hypothetical protein